MILVHICCSVDSHYFLQRLRDDFVDEKIVGFFYNPNIHPFSEYELRLMDVKRSCSMLDIELVDGKYDMTAWFDATKGLEKEPEKGKRCNVCFNLRFQNTASMARDMGIEKITSTLLVSPKKSLDQLGKEGQDISNEYGVDFITLDYRKNNGTQEQSKIAKENALYKQNYCGCLYALHEQRQGQNKIPYELMNPISKQILPSSLQSKLQMYQQRLDIEKKDNTYKIVKNNFLNYRLLRGIVKVDNKAIPSHILYFSILKQKKAKYYIDYSIDDTHYLNRNNIRILNINKFNSIANTHYKSVNELASNSLSVEKELWIREKIDTPYSTNSIIIVDKILDSKYEISIDAHIFDDIEEKLITTNNPRTPQ